MRRLPYELYGASALMAAAIALLVRWATRERSSVKRAANTLERKIAAVRHSA